MTHKTYTGKEFNQIHEGRKFYKLTHTTECHNGFKFQDGLNIDTVEFDPTGDCRPGGLYFTNINNFKKWLGNHMYYRMVTVPDDAKVYSMRSKYKANKIILGPRKTVHEECDDTDILSLLCIRNHTLLREHKMVNNEFLIKFIEKYPSSIFHLSDDQKTEEVCIAAVSKDYKLLKYVKVQTNAIRCSALSNNMKAKDLFVFSPEEKQEKITSYRLEIVNNKPQIISTQILLKE